MSYDERLASRVRRVLANSAGPITERKMFGGICFMVGSSMCCGVLGPDLIVRVGAGQHEEALKQPHTRVFDFTGRPSKGMLYVGPDAIRTDAALKTWIRKGLAFVAGRTG
jgi:TfoX/Sxy family transcriptional regulator of competence genes